MFEITTGSGGANLQVGSPVVADPYLEHPDGDFQQALAAADPIYLRANGTGNGDGSAGDPFLVNTIARLIAGSGVSGFNGIATQNESPVRYEWEAGSYQMDGYKDNDYVNPQVTMLNRTYHNGPGSALATITLAGAEKDVAMWSANYYDFVTNFCLQGFTLDLDATNQPMWAAHLGATCALAIQGKNILCRDLKIRGFGTGKVGRECFVMTGGIFVTLGPRVLENVVFDDIEISDPVTGNLDGMSTVGAGLFSDSNAGATTKNVIGRNIRIDLTGSDFGYTHGISMPLFHDCIMKGVGAGIYQEPNNTNDLDPRNWVRSRNNLYDTNEIGILINTHPNSGSNHIISEGDVFRDCDKIFQSVPSAPYLFPTVVAFAMIGGQDIQSGGGVGSGTGFVVNQVSDLFLLDNIINRVDGATNKVIYTDANGLPCRAYIHNNRTLAGDLVTWKNVSTVMTQGAQYVNL